MKKEYPFNSNYIVYDDGRIYSKYKKDFLTPKYMRDGYIRVQLWCYVNGIKKLRYIGWHRAVAETFLQKPSKDHNVVNHIDGDKHNNSVRNLEWCTQRQNIHHAWNSGLSNKYNHTLKTGFDVYDTVNGMTSSYFSIRDMSQILPNSTYDSIRYAIRTGKLYRGRYVIQKSVTTKMQDSICTSTEAAIYEEIV